MRTLLLDGDREEAAVAIPLSPKITALRRVPYEVVRSASTDHGHRRRDYEANRMTVKVLDAIRKAGGA